MSPNSNIRKRIGQVEALVLTRENKVDWIRETKAYLKSEALFYAIYPSYAEKKVQIENLAKLNEVPSVKTDAYIDDCIKVRGHLKSFCDEPHASLSLILKENTPNTTRPSFSPDYGNAGS